MFIWLFNVYINVVMKEVKMWMRRREVRFLKEGRDQILLGPLYADYLVLRAMVGRLVEVCRRRGLKANSGKSKVMVLGGEEWLECEVYVVGIR